MIDRHTINDSFYCGRLRDDSIVSVMTTGAYVMAEYDEQTGEIRWYRVVNATQKESLHNWLRQHFPIKARVAKPRVVTNKKLAVA
jgi:hypothetical protein